MFVVIEAADILTQKKFSVTTIWTIRSIHDPSKHADMQIYWNFTERVEEALAGKS